MPPPDAPRAAPLLSGGGRGLAPSGAPSHPLPPQDRGRGRRGRGQPPVPGPAAGLQMCRPDARPQGLPLARKRPRRPPRRGGNGVGGTRDLQLVPAHGAVYPQHPQQDGGARAKSQPWAQDGDGAQRGAWHRARLAGSHHHPMAPCPGWEALGAAPGDSSRDRQGPELGIPWDVKGTRSPRAPDRSACPWQARGCPGLPRGCGMLWPPQQCHRRVLAWDVTGISSVTSPTAPAPRCWGPRDNGVNSGVRALGARPRPAPLCHVPAVFAGRSLGTTATSSSPRPLFGRWHRPMALGRGRSGAAAPALPGIGVRGPESPLGRGSGARIPDKASPFLTLGRAGNVLRQHRGHRPCL